MQFSEIEELEQQMAQKTAKYGTLIDEAITSFLIVSADLQPGTIGCLPNSLFVLPDYFGLLTVNHYQTAVIV